MSETAAAPVLRFKAGLVDYNEETHIATPVDLKGQITVTRSEEDPSILSFVWEPRGNRIGGNSDRKQELLLFPGDAEWKHIDKCTTGRVFAIKFNSSGEKSFYWLQSAGFDDEPEKLTPDDIKIKETMDKLLDESVLEESEESGPTTSTTTTTSTATTEPQDAEMTEPAKTETDESTRAAIRNMADILRKTAGGSAGGSAGGFQVPIVSLSHVVPNSEFSQLISQLDESDPALQRLYEAIPASLPRTKASLLKVVSSPFFYRASETLSEALRNAELEGGAPVGRFLANDLGFPYQKEGIEGFVNGIRVQGLKEAQGTQEGQQISKNAIEEDKPSEMDEDEDSDTVDMV